MKRAIAIFGLLAVVAGIPLLLLALSGPPQVPSMSGIALTDTYVPSDVVLDVLAFICWIAWAYVTLVTLVRVVLHVALPIEVRDQSKLGVIAGGITPWPLRRFVDFALGGAIVAATIGASTSASSLRPPAPISATAVPEERTPDAESQSQPPLKRYVVKEGDSLWRIAEKELGSGFRWRELFALNRDRVFDDGERLRSPRLIRTGWSLAIPSRANGREVVPEPSSIPIDTTEPVVTRKAEPVSTSALEPEPAEEPIDVDAPKSPPLAINLSSGATVALSFASGLLTAELLGSLKRRRRHRPLAPILEPESHDQELVSELRRAGASPSAHFLASVDAVTTALRSHSRTWPKILAAIERASGTEIVIEADSCPKDSGGTISPKLQFTSRSNTVFANVGPPFRGEIDKYPAPLERGLLAPIGFSTDSEVVHVSMMGSGGASISGTGAVDLVRTLVLSLAASASPDNLQIVLLGAPFVDLDDVPHVTESRQWIEAEAVLRALKLELLRRARLLMESGSDDLLQHLHSSPADRLSGCVVVATEPPPALKGTIDALAHEAALLGGAVIGLGWTVPGSRLHIEAEEELSITGLDLSVDHVQPMRLSDDEIRDAVAILRSAWEESDGISVDPDSGEAGPTPPVIHVPRIAVSLQGDTSDPPLPGSRLELVKPRPPEDRAAALCLGSLQLFSHGRLVEKGWRSRSLELIAYLIAFPDGVSKDRILEEFWPESDLSKANREFDRVCHYIRRCARAPTDTNRFIEKVLDSWRLLPDEWWIDAWEMSHLVDEAARHNEPAQKIETLRSVLSLYGGEFCNDRYYSWAESVRDRFRKIFLRAAAELAELLVDSGDFQQAVDVLDLAIERDPLCEDIARQAIRLDASLGRRLAATRRYKQLRDVLRNELGVDPDPETQAMMRQIERPTLAKVSR